MIKTGILEEIIQAVLASGRVRDANPLSLLVVAPVECGKTSLIRKWCLKADNVFYTTDATAYGIIKGTNFLRDFAERKLTHIVVPDLLTCLGRKYDTVRTFIHFMNSLIEEGVVDLHTYAVSLSGKIEARAGLITAIPPKAFMDNRRNWAEIGFLSRALPLSYTYSVSTQVEILNFIKEEKHLRETLHKLKLPKRPKKIILPRDMADRIEPYAHLLAGTYSTKFYKLYGFRYQRQLQTLAKAIALCAEKNEVDDECIQKLEEMLDFINLNFTRI